MTRSGAASWGYRDGDTLTPELTIHKLLGGGAAYEAYLAFDEITLAPVIAKVVRPDQLSDESTLRGLRREAATLGSINHPGVARLLRWHDPAHDCGSDHEPGQPEVAPHLVLELIDGPRLSRLIKRHGRLQPQQYLPLAIDLASAVHYLRHVDVVHLDIKPSNVIMGAPARLIDLSVARSAEAAAALASPIGTDDYMAPEQCAPTVATPPSYASDIWGIGATLFHAVAGYRPFPNVDSSLPREQRYPQVAYARGEVAVRPLPEGVEPETAEVLRACLAADPTARPQPREIVAALEPVLLRQPRATLTWRPR